MLLIFLFSGCKIKLGNLVFEPPRVGPTLWEIGVPDRSAAEFYVPDPYPTLMNPILNNHQNRSSYILMSFLDLLIFCLLKFV